MLKVHDDAQMTLPEAATLLGLSLKRLNYWRCEKRFASVGRRAIRKPGLPAGHLYRLGDIRSVAAAIGTGDPRRVTTPPGCLRMGDAASRLGISANVARDYFDKGRITGIVVSCGRNRKVRFPSEESVAVLAAALAKVDRGQSAQAKGDAAEEAANASPVLYGILDAGDVAVLEQRRQRMARSA